MNLYKVSQTANVNWETYDSAVVAADSENAARLIHPSGSDYNVLSGSEAIDGQYGSWTSQDNITVELIGKAIDELESGVIVASFNAG